ncbi:polycomb protein Pcl [Musca vetustissima]|uniref:polycomb protein Pcl n=1 Tax=Musca vetustissima TaxID=27455 RepID=UPI002AB6DF7D|nr:polycomb protein Pcl [Musca vetustissima]
MMNNQFNPNNITGVQGQLPPPPHGQLAQHVTVSPPTQNNAHVLNTFYNAPQHQHHLAQHHPALPPQQQHHHHPQQQLATAAGLYADPRQLQLAAAAAALGASPQRFYTTTSGQSLTTSPPSGHATTHPNTILITNNFTHQQPSLPQNPAEQQRISAALQQGGNIRIVSSSTAPANVASSGGYIPQQTSSQHVFNLNNSKTLQHIFPQHLLQQQQQQHNFHHTPTELLSQHHFTTSAAAGQQHQHFIGAAPSTTTQNISNIATTPLHMPQYYVPAGGNGNSKQILATNSPLQSANAGGAVAGSHNLNNPSPGNSGGGGGVGGSSTVVLDRINICINNLYTDTTSTTSSSSASNSLASTPAQQPSPIIPAIQHKAIIETGPPLGNNGNNNDPFESSSSSSHALVIDEPDSTTTATTPHTPPTTPENTPPTPSSTSVVNKTNANSISTTTKNISSPMELQNLPSTTKTKFANVAENIEKMAQEETKAPNNKNNINTSTISSSNVGNTNTTTVNTPLTPPTPPSPESVVTTNSNKGGSGTPTGPTTTTASVSVASPPPPPTPPPPFNNGEDVFIKRQDGRFYLGTVIDMARQQFLVRFDDKTEQWCNPGEMRKLGGGGSGTNSSCNNNNNSNSSSTNSNDSQHANQPQQQPMCVSCKQQQPDSKVEICERCGRGYHRKCTMETSKNSGIWYCKRCDKPMKLSAHPDDEDMDVEDDDDDEEEPEEEEDMEPLQVGDVCHQLPYDLNSLTWDNKHRVNEQQIYCYCGKSGKFDQNMLQCWHCLNWYHIDCTQKFKGNLLRGDVFFVFCCTVCNNGEEYLRRLQVDWVDLLHLIIYNLSTMKKHQNHKYHHLLKDIYPFALEKRKSSLPMPKEWKMMPENEFLDKLRCTLKDNPDRFVGGKELKRDHYFFALRTNGPPFVQPPPSLKRRRQHHQLINDDFVMNKLKLKLLPEAPENLDIQFNPVLENLNQTPTSKPKTTSDENKCPRDIYAFDDTSDDEIPIKIILDKAKKKTKSTDHQEEQVEHDMKSSSSTTTTLGKFDVEDDNANDAIIPSSSSSIQTQKDQQNASSSPKKEQKILNEINGNSLDEKPQTSSRKRKAFSLTKSYVEKQRLIDSSSDENSSSSSRCTSLDLIIPPPKNFLGQNNPFRQITPKKKSPSSAQSLSSGGGRKSVSFGLVNGLDFSSKLAGLKTSGLFPKLNSKAAGQPRTVRTIKRRLSAKDITIGPNQEVRRRRIRRLSANVEVISTTTINPIPTNYYPIHAKDLLAAAAASTTTAASLFNTQSTTTNAKLSSSSNAINSLNINNSNSSPTSSSSNATSTNTTANEVKEPETKPLLPAHGRRLRQRPPKSSPNTSRRNSVSSNQSSASSTTTAGSSSLSSALSHTQQQQHQHQHNSQNAQQSHEDLKQTVNKYFGIVNRIESGEQFSIRAKRKLPNGQMQYLIEWGGGGEQPLPQSQPPADTKLSQEEEQNSQNHKMDVVEKETAAATTTGTSTVPTATTTTATDDKENELQPNAEIKTGGD